MENATARHLPIEITVGSSLHEIEHSSPTDLRDRIRQIRRYPLEIEFVPNERKGGQDSAPENIEWIWRYLGTANKSTGFRWKGMVSENDLEFIFNVWQAGWILVTIIDISELSASVLEDYLYFRKQVITE